MYNRERRWRLWWVFLIRFGILFVLWSWFCTILGDCRRWRLLINPYYATSRLKQHRNSLVFQFRESIIIVNFRVVSFLFPFWFKWFYSWRIRFDLLIFFVYNLNFELIFDLDLIYIIECIFEFYKINLMNEIN